MDTFVFKNDNNRLYFKNYERVSPEEELKNAVDILKKKGR